MRFYSYRTLTKKVGYGLFQWANPIVKKRSRIVITCLRDRQRKLHIANKKLVMENEKLGICVGES